VRNLLVMSPRFPPKNAPDMHRVHSLPHYRRFGWHPTVLAITSETCDGADVDKPYDLFRAVLSVVVEVVAAAFEFQTYRR
jgi:hypothetical protein